MTQDLGASPTAIHSARPTLPFWLDQRRIEMRLEFDNGPLIVSAPRVLTPNEIADLEQYLSLLVQSFKRRAQAIEARRAATGGAGAVHESAVGEADAPKGADHA